MKATLASLAFTTGVRSLNIRHTGCCFNLVAHGSPVNGKGPVCEIDDGQLRIAQSGLQPAKFCLNPNGGLTDGHGRGCVLTDVDQFQCDAGKAPFGGFSFDCAGHLTFGQNHNFYACPTGDHGGYNLYTKPVRHQDYCVKIVITGDDAPCKPDCHTPKPIPTCPVDSHGACVPPPSRPAIPPCEHGDHGCLPPQPPSKTKAGCDCPPNEHCDCKPLPTILCDAKDPKECLKSLPRPFCKDEHCPPLSPKEMCSDDRCIFFLGIDVFAQCEGENCTVFDDFGWLAAKCKDGKNCPFPSKPTCDLEHDNDCIVTGEFSLMFAWVPKSAVQELVNKLQGNYVKGLGLRATA